MIKHTVKSGDTLWAIANTYGSTVSKIAADNNIQNPDLIHVGQVLIINTGEKSNDLGVALSACLEALENLPEFKTLEDLINGES